MHFECAHLTYMLETPGLQADRLCHSTSLFCLFTGSFTTITCRLDCGRTQLRILLLVLNAFVINIEVAFTLQGSLRTIFSLDSVVNM